jgi:zinc/manganese transport system permease protein
MAAPITICLVLVGIHVYFGLHVIRRGIIFVDIALAQFSALGAALGLAAGIALGTVYSKAIGVTTAVVAAWLISLTRKRRDHVPQEAFIGIAYAVASAATILMLVGVPHGGEEIKALLVGSILWVSWTDVAQCAVLYALIGLFHYRYRKAFMAITDNPERAKAAGIKVGWWDFLFFASLGATVTQSVQVAGVLLVFTLLVVPAVMAVLARPEAGAAGRLALGWAIGAVIASGGAALSYLLDLPTGATIVCAFGICLVVQLLFRRAPE